MLGFAWIVLCLVIGEGIAAWTGLPVPGSVLGLAVGAYIGYEAIHLIYRAVQGLLDRALTEEELVKLRAVLEATRHPESRVEELATRVAGQVRFIRFKLLVQGGMTVEESHALCDVLEASIRQDFTPCQVDIHIEPLR
jgi:divalent metal cation (Fe/Co/Zn/Cd) transporter